MSNIAQLLISNQNGMPVTEEDMDAEAKSDFVNIPILESESVIPIFWFTLFSPKNIETYIDPDDEIDIPYLVTTVIDAKANFERHLPGLRKTFTNIDRFVPNWQQTLSEIKEDFIKVQLYEILEMSEDGYDILKPALSFLEEQSEESTIAFIRLTCFPDVYDEKTRSVVDQELENGRNTKDYLVGYDPWK